MGLVFHTVRWKNFLSTGNDFSEMKLDDAQTTLVVGANGYGKSTFMDAICYALYNKAFRKINKPQLVNSVNNKHCLVEIEFSSNLDEFIVRRGMKPNVFEIIKNGEMINQEANSRDYQEILEKYILKLTFKSFCQVVILGSASFVPFMQLPTGQRREIIEDLLDIQIFTIMNMLLKDKISSNNGDLLDADYRLEMSNAKIKMQEEYIKNMMTSSEDLIRGFKNRISKYKEEMDIEARILDEKQSELSKILKKTVGEKALASKVNEMSSLINKLSDKKVRLEDEIAFFLNNDGCPTCQQIIDEEFKGKTIVSKKNDLVQIETGIESLKETFEIESERLNEIKRFIDFVSNLNVDISLKSSKIKNIEGSIKDLEEQISKVVERNAEYNYDGDNIRKYEKERDDVAQEKKNLFEYKEIQRVAGTILKDGGIKSRIIRQYIPIINKLINKYLAAMDFFIQFEIDETFSETIKSRFRDVFSYSSFSEGEKTRIDLALLFAWRTIAKLRNSASTNLLILDEVFDGSLDSVGSEDFLNILYSVTGEANIFVISHKTDQLKDKFDRVVEFEKKNNFSRITSVEENLVTV